MIGSERLSQLWIDHDEAGNPVGQEFRAALADAHTSLGVDRVRARAIFHDDVGVFQVVDGKPTYDFSGVERIVDELISIGLRPVLELGFMPRDLASDPDATVFTYRGIISPPKDWSQWGELCGRLAVHLVERYGIDEVATWGFEIWNEPDLEVFWTASREEYFRLYDEAVHAIKAVDRRLPVGGPATAAVDWIEEFAAHAEAAGSPVDFVSTHSYGNAPVDLRPLLARHGLDNVEIWWTEWGVGHTHFAPVHDTPYSAAFVLRGMKSAQRGTVDALAYWVISDHFEELGRPPRLFHGGFGLLSVGNLRKPRYWALRFAQELGDDVLATSLTGDGADGLVETWAARRADGSVDVLLWNASPTAAKYAGDATLERTVSVCLKGLQDSGYRVLLNRIDNDHTNIAAHFDGEWPDAAQWQALRDADRLDETELYPLAPEHSEASLQVVLPMPGVARIRLIPT